MAFPILPVSRLIRVSSLIFRYTSCGALLRAGRWLVFFSVIHSFAWKAAQPSRHIPLPARVTLDVVFFVAGVLETTALSVSLPPGCDPPLNHVLRHFHIGSKLELFKRIVDAAFAILGIAVGCCSQVLPLYYLAYIVLSLLPLSRAISKKADFLCKAVSALVLLPFAVVVGAFAVVLGVVASP